MLDSLCVVLIHDLEAAADCELMFIQFFRLSARIFRNFNQVEASP